ncbi:Flp pilus assembly protein TadG [Salibacterium salarium]|uniref:TadE/TadG family type IV pilus assembly protein n=1 Tax=Salibacterium salarium TaxID=284579 RepID=UPI00277FB4B0|nr:Tad domain-containing protein [Salibacterium salarium]MDQ0298882.1 Flp pilus assembly protein TadG [Salibacterium salarium]
MIKNIKNERGSVYPLAAAMITVMIAVGGLLIDGGFVLYKYTQLASAVDSAAIGALDSYDEGLWEEEGKIEIDEGRARSQAQHYLNKNMTEASNLIVTVNNANVEVHAEATVPMFFMSLFGYSEIHIESEASSDLS